MTSYAGRTRQVEVRVLVMEGLLPQLRALGMRGQDAVHRVGEVGGSGTAEIPCQQLELRPSAKLCCKARRLRPMTSDAVTPCWQLQRDPPPLLARGIVAARRL